LPIAFLVLAVMVSAVAANIGPAGTAEAAPRIGENSCQGDDACIDLGANAVIGDDSCNGFQSCVSFDGRTGDGSCNGYQSCVVMPGRAGDNSCNGYQACVVMEGALGEGSCNTFQACVVVDAGVDIGHDSCNGFQTCVVVEADIGDDSCYDHQSCVVVSAPIGDCEFNPGCAVSVSKTAQPSTVPVSGGPVSYHVVVEFDADEYVNYIVDSQVMLNPETQCQALGPGNQNLGFVSLPAFYDAGTRIVCQYSGTVPPGVAGSAFVNTFTINVGEVNLCNTSIASVLPDLPDLPDLPIVLTNDVSSQACIIAEDLLSATDISQGELVGTADVSDTASVLYVASEQRPNIGAGLSALFAGGSNNPAAQTQPAPVPTLVGAGSERSPIIQPPNTGDAGLADRTACSDVALFVAAAIAGLGTATLLMRRNRI
jgi:hypothetical protein